MDVINLGAADGLPPMSRANVVEKFDAGSSPAPDAHNARTTWLSTVNEDGSPHVTAVGALWLDGSFWFQTGSGTRKGRNVARDPRRSIAVSIRDADVVAEGEAERETDPATLTRLTITLHEEGAFWRIVQYHASFPVSNEESIGMTVTTSLDDILVQVQGDATPSSALSEDGSVTIVFTDIEGSTALMETLGESSWLELLTWHEGVIRRQTALFGGTVVKGQGDGFMLAFPAIGAGVSCAMAIQRTLGPGWNGVQVSVRIGVHCGNAKAEEGDFFGRTVVVAARVAEAATGREILISRAVQEGLGGAFPLERARTLSLKGLSGEHVVFALEWR